MDPREVGDLILQGDGIVVVIVSEHRGGKAGWISKQTWILVDK